MSLSNTNHLLRLKAHHPNLRRRIACPYFKRSPEEYPRADSCFRNGFKDIHKMKEHLHRVHNRSIQCPRCYTVFSENLELSAHLRTLGSSLCQPLQGHEALDGYNQTQARELSCRMRGKPLIQKWESIWRILFPSDKNDLIPSPWWTPQNALQHSEVLDYLARHENFIRERLPGFVHSRVECLIDSTVNEQLSGQMDQILRDCLEVTFAGFKDGEGAVLVNSAATAIQAPTPGAEQFNALPQDFAQIAIGTGSAEGSSGQSMHLNTFAPSTDMNMDTEEPFTAVQQSEHFIAGTYTNVFGHQNFKFNRAFSNELQSENPAFLNTGYADTFLPACTMKTQKSWEFDVGGTGESIWDDSTFHHPDELEQGGWGQ